MSEYCYRVTRVANALDALSASRTKANELDAAWQLHSMSREISQSGIVPDMPEHVAARLRRFRNGS